MPQLNHVSINEQQHELFKLTIDAYLFAGNESHEDIITNCGGGNIRTWCIELRVAKFLPVLKSKKTYKT